MENFLLNPVIPRLSVLLAKFRITVIPQIYCNRLNFIYFKRY